MAALSIGLAAAGMAPALAHDDHPATHPSGEGGLLGLGGLLGGEGGLLGSGGLLGETGGLLPGLLGGHTTMGEFADGTGGLVDGLSVLPQTLTGPPVGGEDTAENVRIAGGVLSGILDLGSILGGLSGRM